MENGLIAALGHMLHAPPPATAEQIRAVSASFGPLADPDYLELFTVMNGAEGSVAEPLGYIRLWRTDEVLELNAIYCEFLTDVVLIGTDGGNEAYGLTTRDHTIVVVRVPFVVMAEEFVELVAESVEEFVRVLLGPEIR